MTGLLLRASLQGAVFALVVLVACRAMPRLSPSVRTALWWCVAAKFVVTLFAVAPITVPVLPAADAVAVAEPTLGPDASDRVMSIDALPGGLVTPSIADTATIAWTSVAGYALLALWLVGLALAMIRMLRDWRHTRGIIRTSVAAHESMHTTVRELASLLGVRTVPDVRQSHQVESPMVTGIRHPTILVPAARFPALSPEQQRMALCHELAHMRRGDLWLGLVPAVAERLFFFHPLARLAAREYAFWREAACDERVIVALGASPQSYGRLLLALGVSRHTAPFSAAGAAWSFLNLKRRIAMLGHPSSSARARAAAAVVTSLAMLAVMPVKAVARDAQQVRPASPVQPTRTPATATARSAAPRSEATVAPARAVAAAAPTPVAAARATSSAAAPLTAVAAATPLSAATTAREATPVAAAVATASATGYAYAYGSQQEVSFVYFKDSNSQTMSGSSADMRRAREHRRGDEPLLWFERRGREYIVRDRDVLRDVEKLWAPVSEIGEQQGRIGAQQGVIGMRQGQYGARQGEIGAAQGVVGAKQGVVAAQLGVLAAREARGLTSSERREIEREREKLREDMRELDREMAELGRRMRQVDPPQDLGRDMESLGREMSALGRRMERASREANEGMLTLIERAVRDGTAQQVR